MLIKVLYLNKFHTSLKCYAKKKKMMAQLMRTKQLWRTFLAVQDKLKSKYIFELLIYRQYKKPGGFTFMLKVTTGSVEHPCLT